MRWCDWDLIDLAVCCCGCHWRPVLDKERLKEKQHALTQFSIRKPKLKEEYLRLCCCDIVPSHYSGKTCDPVLFHLRSDNNLAMAWPQQSCIQSDRPVFARVGVGVEVLLCAGIISLCAGFSSVTPLWLWTAASLTTVSIATVCCIFSVSANKNVPISQSKVIREHCSQPAAGIEGSGMSIVCSGLTGS